MVTQQPGTGQRVVRRRTPTSAKPKTEQADVVGRDDQPSVVRWTTVPVGVRLPAGAVAAAGDAPAARSN